MTDVNKLPSASAVWTLRSRPFGSILLRMWRTSFSVPVFPSIPRVFLEDLAGIDCSHALNFGVFVGGGTRRERRSLCLRPVAGVSLSVFPIFQFSFSRSSRDGGSIFVGCNYYVLVRYTKFFFF